MKKNWRYIFILQAAISLLFMGCSSSSPKKKVTHTDTSGAIEYLNKLDGMLVKVINKSDDLHRIVKDRNEEEIDKKLQALLTCIEENADKASEMGGYRGDTALNYAVLDVLEFYESLYIVVFPPLIEAWLVNDTGKTRELQQDYRARMKEQLPGLEKKLKIARQEFVKVYNVPIDIEESIIQLTGQSVPDYLQEYGFEKDDARIGKIRDQLKNVDSKKDTGLDD